MELAPGSLGIPLAINMVVTNWVELKRSIELNSVQILLSDHPQ